MADEPSKQTVEGGWASWLRLRTGRGVVGKTSHVAIVGLAVFGIVALRIEGPWFLLAVAGGAMILVFGHQIPMLRWAERNPRLALTEGSEIVQLEQIAMAAKNIPMLPTTPPIPDPQNPTIILEATDAS